VEVKECRGSVSLSQLDELPQALCGGDSISSGAVTAFDLNSKVVADRVEISAWQVWKQFAREAYSADAWALEQKPCGTLDFSRDECPIKAGVVGDEYAPLERAEEITHNRFERWRAAHCPGIDAGEPRNELRNRNPGVHEGVKQDCPVERHHRDFHDAVAAEGADAGRFHIHDGPAALLEHRARLRRRRGEGPAAIGRAAEAFVRREQRGGDAVGRMAIRLRDAEDVADDRETAGGAVLQIRYRPG
jgi:hypothetical protein